MQFRSACAALEPIEKISVDGDPCGAGLHLSHWPGNRTPLHLKADLSVDIVLRALDAPDRSSLFADRELVTNDHYDTDGLLSVWVLFEPELARAHRSELIATAAAGDFYEFTNPHAVRADLTIRAFGDPERSPIASRLRDRSRPESAELALEAVLPLLPHLLHDASDHRALWEEDYRRISERMALGAAGKLSVTHHLEESLTVIETPVPLDHYCRNALSCGDRILELVHGREGTTCQLFYRELLWYDLQSRPATRRHVLLGTAERLNRIEPERNAGSWGATEWSPALRFVANGPREARMVSRKEALGFTALKAAEIARIVREDLRSLG